MSDGFEFHADLTSLVSFASASGDFNPIHHDEVSATQGAGYPSVFAHGRLGMGPTGRMRTEWLGDGVPVDFGVRFVNQVWPGDTLTVCGVVRAIEAEGDRARVEIELETRNQNARPVVRGQVAALLPRRC